MSGLALLSRRLIDVCAALGAYGACQIAERIAARFALTLFESVQTMQNQIQDQHGNQGYSDFRAPDGVWVQSRSRVRAQAADGQHAVDL